MTVYVDRARNRFGRMIMCHMLAFDLDELHRMAEAIGMRREWFQSAGTAPHYDVSLDRRKRALRLGAIEADREKIVELIRFWRNARRTGTPGG